ncbi:DODA-type extradiol aromatic ring-opening family dioxygenase [Paenibacillus harenae]|uniref:DODA-type extradiol aromatic ring-opening family dioxygenase n=1 Tax=Paenibacillus harenae TaxID=306543 RepID=UPI00278C95EF|nr:class III extradiol ring-cleavage dioxygenase [Paenibacillus harenae]MDQ0061098.1 4,5-DOPA dioxygenase extradiol [Paenibacillus harenae]
MKPLFLAHGSPMLAVEQNEYSRFLQHTGASLKPDAIVIFTAHWETEAVTISSKDDKYETIYDFYGFPDELYQVKYPAKGSTKVAALVGKLLSDKGIPVAYDETRGLDHGSWTMLKHMFPKADIPVVQVSVNPYRPAEEQYRIGEALRSLGSQNILLIGSGVTVHNLRAVNWGRKEPESWAVEFDDWLIEKMNEHDTEALFQYDSLAPHARMAVPRAEHLVPLYIALGGGDPASTPTIVFRSYEFGTLSYLSLQF